MNGSFAVLNRRNQVWTPEQHSSCHDKMWVTCYWIMVITMIPIMETFAFPGEPFQPAFHSWFITHLSRDFCFPLSRCILPAPCHGLGSSGPVSSRTSLGSRFHTQHCSHEPHHRSSWSAHASPVHSLPPIQLLTPTVSRIISTAVN